MQLMYVHYASIHFPFEETDYTKRQITRRDKTKSFSFLFFLKR